MGRIPKATISFRLKPSLKEDLEQEAYQEDMTTSQYVEQVLSNRTDAEELEALYARIEALEAENEALQNTQNALESNDEEQDELREELTRVTTNYEKQEAEMEQLAEELETAQTQLEEQQTLVSFDTDEYEAELLHNTMDEVRAYYPELTDMQIITASLRAAIRNENNDFWIIRIKNCIPSPLKQVA